MRFAEKDSVAGVHLHAALLAVRRSRAASLEDLEEQVTQDLGNVGVEELARLLVGVCRLLLRGSLAPDAYARHLDVVAALADALRIGLTQPGAPQKRSSVRYELARARVRRSWRRFWLHALGRQWHEREPPEETLLRLVLWRWPPRSPEDDRGLLRWCVVVPLILTICGGGLEGPATTCLCRGLGPDILPLWDVRHGLRLRRTRDNSRRHLRVDAKWAELARFLLQAPAREEVLGGDEAEEGVVVRRAVRLLCHGALLPAHADVRRHARSRKGCGGTLRIPALDAALFRFALIQLPETASPGTATTASWPHSDTVQARARRRHGALRRRKLGGHSALQEG